MSPVPMHLRPGWVRERQIKLELGLQCEVCGVRAPHPILEIHYIRGAPSFPGSPPEDLEAEILILCPACHRDIHTFGVQEDDQRSLLLFRPDDLRRRIRRILGAKIKPICIPEQDLEERVRDAFPPHWGWGT